MNETEDVIHDQLVSGLANMTSEDMEKVNIAYEPVWAIGTGENATLGDATKASQIIREHVKQLFGAKVAKAIPILYGGSVNSDNALSYLQNKELNGLLIGGASLKPDQFIEIARIAHAKNRNEGS